MFKNGIPSESTLRRVENGIDELALADRMQQFIEQFHSKLLRGCAESEIVCIDGKAQCGTVLPNGRNPNIVSAYVPKLGITLATEACQEKSNEIKAVPSFLDKIDLSGKFPHAVGYRMIQKCETLLYSTDLQVFTKKEDHFCKMSSSSLLCA